MDTGKPFLHMRDDGELQWLTFEELNDEELNHVVWLTESSIHHEIRAFIQNWEAEEE